MGSEAEAEPTTSIPKLPLFSIPPLQSPEPTGMLTPPLHATASVPFRWEEEPGRPRTCTTLCKTNSAAARCLELPPRLLLTDGKTTKMPSPTTVLEGPYVGKSIFQSSSFRLKRDRQGSFRGSTTSPDDEREQLGAMVLSKRGHKERGFFGSWGRRRTTTTMTTTLNLKGKRSVDEDSFVFSSSVDGEGDGVATGVKMRRVRRSGSFLSVPHVGSHVWATIYEGFKQVIPWRGRKLKKDGLVV